MGLFTIRQKQHMLLTGITAAIVLAIIWTAIKYWYITLPVLAALTAAIIYRVRVVRRRNAEKSPTPSK